MADSPFLQSVVKGLVILFAVLLDRNADVIRGWFRRRPPAAPARTDQDAAELVSA